MGVINSILNKVFDIFFMPFRGLNPWAAMLVVSLLTGILAMNRKIQAESPALYDLTPTVLKIFGIEPPQEMLGKAIL